MTLVEAPGAGPRSAESPSAGSHSADGPTAGSHSADGHGATAAAKPPLATLPPKQSRALRRAVRLEWATVALLLTHVAALAATMGGSQAMKTAWIDDLLSLIPPLVFLGAEAVRTRPPTRRFPYGFTRVVSIASLLSSFALLGMGAFLLEDALAHLAKGQVPTLGTVTLAGHTVWSGWLMVAAAVYSGATAAWIGAKKLPLAKVLHNRALQADAAMNKADWLMALAAAVGILGVGLGLGWADSAAAAVLAVDILWDGCRGLGVVFAELIDRVPTPIEGDGEEPIVGRLEAHLAGEVWIERFSVRVHQRGPSFVGEALVVPRVAAGGDAALLERIEGLTRAALAMDWRLTSFVVMPVRRLPEGSPA